MNVVISVLSLVYLRHLEPVVRALAAGGRRIDLVVHEDSHMEGLEALAGDLQAEFSNVKVMRAPELDVDPWSRLPLDVRSCLDYLQFLDPKYHGQYAQRAVKRAPPFVERWCERPLLGSRPGRAVLGAALRVVERSIPSSPLIERFLAERRPDLFITTPLVGLRTAQPDWLKSARALGVPTALSVASWDNLSSKSTILLAPDAVLVWNGLQKREAVELHGIRPKTVVVTGAQLFDQWFEWTPRPREEFCRRVGLPADLPYVLYTCSTPFKGSVEESEFVVRWIAHLRSSGLPELERAAILVRPHPKRHAEWQSVDLSRFKDVVLWPLHGGNPATPEAKADYFDSLYHSDAVVGLNTTAMIEAGIVGRPVHTILVEQFAASQEKTLHFHYLTTVGGGLLRVARDLREHGEGLAETLRRSRSDGNVNEAFLREFIRPYGLDVAATPRFVDAVQLLAARGRRTPWRVPLLLRPVSAALYAWATEASVRAAREKRFKRLQKARRRSGGLRILFAMPSPGCLPAYESTVRLLAERGHVVLLAYADVEKRAGVPLRPRRAGKRIKLAGTVPSAPRLWTSLARALRLGADYLRYLDPRFAKAGYLRRRMEEYLPKPLGFLRSIRGLPGWVVGPLLRGLAFLERAVPADPAVDAFLLSCEPDVVVTPPAARGDEGVRQTEIVKSARRIGVPVAVAVGGWDDLTSTGLIRGGPDAVIVWNEVQEREAVELHGIGPQKVAVTGAPLFDQWFARRPGVSLPEFRRRVGLPGEDPFLLYVGSPRSIAAPKRELKFVRRWIRALRDSGDPGLRERGVLIRPHPLNFEHWVDADLSDLGNVAVWPRVRPRVPLDEADQAEYIDSLHHSAAVVGVNTTAMIEAAVTGRPVYAIRDQEFVSTQEGAPPFRHLLPEGGGYLRVAHGMEEHLAQLSEDLRHPQRVEAQISGFVGSFVRPNGIAKACTPAVADAIENVAWLEPKSRWLLTGALLPVRGVLALLALAGERVATAKLRKHGRPLGERLRDGVAAFFRNGSDARRWWFLRMRKAIGCPQEAARRGLATELARRSELAIPPARGFAIVEAGRFPETAEVVQAARELASRNAPLKRKANKGFMVSLLNEGDVTPTLPLMRLALRPDILGAVSGYLGMVPLVTHLDVFFSSAADERMISSKLFHCDGDDTTQVKVFVLCSDVTTDNGPMTMIPADTSQRIRDALGYEYRNRVEDEELLSIVGEDELHLATGPAGTMCFVDTSRCFHYGSRIKEGAEPRLVAMIQYLTPYSFMLPRDYRRAAPFRHLVGSASTDLERLALGAD